MGIVNAFRALGHQVTLLSLPGSDPEHEDSAKPDVKMPASGSPHTRALRKLMLQALTRELTTALRRSLSNSSKLATRLRTIMQGFARDSE